MTAESIRIERDAILDRNFAFIASTTRALKTMIRNLRRSRWFPLLAIAGGAVVAVIAIKLLALLAASFDISFLRDVGNNVGSEGAAGGAAAGAGGAAGGGGDGGGGSGDGSGEPGDARPGWPDVFAAFADIFFKTAFALVGAIFGSEGPHPIRVGSSAPDGCMSRDCMGGDLPPLR